MCNTDGALKRGGQHLKRGEKMTDKLELVFQMAKYTKHISLPMCKRLMRLASTHIRIETELTNGYKTASGQWDEVQTIIAKNKRDRVDRKMQSILNEAGEGIALEYGALTVRAKLADGREVYIP